MEDGIHLVANHDAQLYARSFSMRCVPHACDHAEFFANFDFVAKCRRDLEMHIAHRIGVAAFRSALETTVRDPEALRLWYHDVISLLASTLPVNTVLIKGLWWREIDTPQDLAELRASFARRELTSGFRDSPGINTVLLKV